MRTHQHDIESLDAAFGNRVGRDGEVELMRRHAEQEQIQAQRRDLHREIRDTHRAVLEHLARLRAALGQALHRAV